ncbi:MAG TPA: hypothetical protein VFU23_16515 [Gemmatimonadales bacterium]|nr:hypothetical protein [Gemmatimonadales bacterium]
MSRFVNAGAGLLIALAAAGCSSGDGTTAPAGSGHVVFQLATAQQGSTAGPATAAVTVTVGTDVIVITDVQLVARRIRLEQTIGDCAPDAPSTSEGTGNEQSEEAADTPRCPEIKVGPFLLAPPLTEGTQTAFTADLPAGTYRKLHLLIWKPSQIAEDEAFRTAHPEFATISIKVTGTFNGTAFTFTSDLQAKEDITFPSPVDVAEGATTTVTLLMDVKGWFLGLEGGALLNPSALDAGNKALVEANIKNSFAAFGN